MTASTFTFEAVDAAGIVKRGKVQGESAERSPSP